MRAIFKASISFGLVNVPVKLYSATEDHDLKAHQVHAADNGRIRYRRVCEACDEAVESRDIAKMYEHEDSTVILTEDDLSTLAEANNREIEVKEFVPAGDIDPLMFDRSYFLGPDGGTKAYVLLAGTMAQTDRVAIVRFSMRDKTHLAALRVVGKGDILAIHTLRWPDEIRQPDFPELDKAPKASEAEMKVAAQLVGSMNAEFNADRYRDVYQDELRELVAARAGEGDDGTEEVSELLAKLEASTVARKPASTARRRGRKVADKPVRRAKALAGVS